MEGDFAKLASHETHNKVLAGFLRYRIPKITGSQISDILSRTAKKKLSSAAALMELRDIHNNSMFKDEQKSDARGDYDENRISARIRDIDPFEAHIKSAGLTTYLDIGCGSGTITAGLGSHFGLPAENIFGADIASWAGHEHEKESAAGFTFKQIIMSTAPELKYSIDIPSGSCQLISLLMVLHHIQNDLLPLVFREILRILAPNGLVLIREHDSPNEMIDSLINIEHGIFEVVIEKLTDGESFGKNYYGKYRTTREWRDLFANYGFTHLCSTKQRGYTRGYYSLFQRAAYAIPPIDAKNTPELIQQAESIGAKKETIDAARNNEDLKKLIIGGRRGLVRELQLHSE